MQFSGLFSQTLAFFAPVMQKLFMEPGHGVGYSGHQWHEVRISTCPHVLQRRTFNATYNRGWCNIWIPRENQQRRNETCSASAYSRIVVGPVPASTLFRQ